MALAACGIPFSIVTPQKWKTAGEIAAGSEKEGSRLRALQLFLGQAAHLTRKKDHARADAMLLAHFGMNERAEYRQLVHEKRTADIQEALNAEFGK